MPNVVIKPDYFGHTRGHTRGYISGYVQSAYNRISIMSEIPPSALLQGWGVIFYCTLRYPGYKYGYVGNTGEHTRVHSRVHLECVPCIHAHLFRANQTWRNSGDDGLIDMCTYSRDAHHVKLGIPHIDPFREGPLERRELHRLCHGYLGDKEI